MCFFNSQNRRALEIAKRYGRTDDVIELARGIIEEQKGWKDRSFGYAQDDNEGVTSGVVQKAFLNPDCFIVTRNPGLQTAKWGLIPFWVREVKQAESMRKMTANARAETVFTQASFRDAIKKRRCLVPSTGFYEYHHLTPDPSPKERGGAVPFRLFLPDMEIFSLAGVFEEWKNPETKETVRTFSVLTVEANKLCAFIHNGGRHPGRMPAIIPASEEYLWLDPGLGEEEIRALLKPYEAGEMKAVEMEKDYLRRAG